jgi:hypothetical protein
MTPSEIFDEIENDIGQIQYMIDQIDETTFGELGKLFDNMAERVADARKYSERFRREVDWESVR